MSDEIIAQESESPVQVAHQIATSPFFYCQGGSKITLSADQSFYAEGFLKFFEVQLRYLQIEFIRRVDSRFVCRDISLTLPAEDVHGKGFEEEYSLVRLHGSLEVLDSEILLQ